jgi:exodeoxyribonuclease V alpha subunit
LILNDTLGNPLSIFKVTRNAYVSRNGIVFTAEEVNADSLNLAAVDRRVAVRIEKANSQSLLNHLVKGNIFYIPHKVRYAKRKPSKGINEILVADYIIPYSPSRKQIVTYLSDNSRFKGVGRGLANKLWSNLGEDIYEALNTGNVQLLLKHIPVRATQDIIQKWYSPSILSSIEFCRREIDLETDTIFQVIDVYGERTKLKIKEDPFRLDAFGVSYEKCAKYADRLSVSITSDLRIAGAIEYCLSSALSKSKTTISLQNIAASAARLLPTVFVEESTVERIVRSSPARFQIVGRDDIQSNGTFFIGSVIANHIFNLLSQANNQRFMQSTYDYEKLREIKFTDEQVEAINSCLFNSVCIIDGSAGSGKTELIRGVFNTLTLNGLAPILLAPTGKAVDKLCSVTGAPAQTIARFLYHQKYQHEEVVLIIDECSMLDCLTLYKIFTSVSGLVKIVLVGDQNQLPPPYHGAVFHQLLKSNFIPKVSLNGTQRTCENSEIPHIASEILRGAQIAPKSDDVRLEEFKTNFSIKKRLLELYKDDVKDTQILCATNEQASTLNEDLNSIKTESTVFYESPDTFKKVNSGLGLQDRVLCTSNVSDQGIFNGMTGKITKRYQRTRKFNLNNGQLSDSYGQLTTDDGATCELTSKVLSTLKLGNAITVHKSQGSEYKRVILVMYKNSFFTRQQLYTAITRATDEVIVLSIAGALSAAISNDSTRFYNDDLLDKIEALFARKLPPERAA